MSRNEITGDVLSNHKGDKDLYDAGWDRIFGNKKTLMQQRVSTDKCISQAADMARVQNMLDALDKLREIQCCSDSKACGCLKSCGGTREEYDSDCFGWNNCSYCDNGWFPCNQNCVVFG